MITISPEINSFIKSNIVPIQLEQNTFYIYPSLKPKKGTSWFGEKIFYEDGSWFNIWIANNNKIYYIASNNHPINRYSEDQPIILLCHFFYVMMNYNNIISHGTQEHMIINQLMFQIINYLKHKSENAYLYASVDPIVKKLFMEHNMCMDIDTFKISELKSRISCMRYKQIELKNSCKKSFDNFKLSFNQLSNNIIEKISNIQFPKKEKIVKDVDVQINLYSEQVTQLKKNAIELKKQLGKYQKDEDDKIVMTMDEYSILMKTNREHIENAKTEGYNMYKKDLLLFLQNNPLEYKQVLMIMNLHDSNEISDIIQVWLIQRLVKAYHLSLVNHTMVEKVKSHNDMLCFTSFWKTIIMKNISKLKANIFKDLLREWINFLKLFKKIDSTIEDCWIDICFSNYAAIYLNKLHYNERSFVPTFFYLLFSECMNIEIFLGIVNCYQINKEKTSNKDKLKLLNDFELIYISNKSKNMDTIIVDKDV